MNAELLARLSYDRTKGVFYWIDALEPNRKRLMGRIAGTVDKNGYRVLTFKKRMYKVHRMVWFVEKHHLPAGAVIDHINGDLLDNRIENLRLVSHTTNMRNTYRHRAGKLLGCGFHKASNSWRAFARINGRQVHIGQGFPTERAAHLAYLKFMRGHASA